MTKKNKLIALFLLALLTLGMSFALSNALNTNTLDLKSLETFSPQTLRAIEQKEEDSNSPELKLSSTKLLAIQKIIEASPIQEQKILLRKLLSTADEKELIELASYFSELDLNRHSYDVLKVILTQWAKISAFDALTFSQKKLPTPFNQAAAKAIITKLCRSTETLKECVAALPSNAFIDNALLSIANDARQNNHFSVAVLVTSTVADEEKRNSEISRLTQSWLSYDPDDAFHWAVEHSQFINIARKAIEKIVETDPWQAYNLVSGINEDHGDNRSLMFKSIISSLIKEGDFLTVMSVLESTSQHQSIASVAREWIETDPKTALEWALTYEEHSVLALRAVDELTKHDHWEAYRIASQIPTNKAKLREDMFNSIFSDRANNTDYHTIIEMLEQFPSTENQEAYYPTFLEQWSWDEPYAAIDAILKFPESDAKTIFLATAMSSLAKKSPEDALRVSRNIKNTDIQANATGGVIAGWAVNDFKQVIDWVKNEPSSAKLDQSIDVASRHLLESTIDNESLMLLIKNIYSEEIRQELISEFEKRQPLDDDF